MKVQTSKDVAKELGISIRLVQYLAKTKGLGNYRIDRARNFTDEEVEVMRNRDNQRKRKESN